MNRSRDFLVGLVFFGLLVVLGVFTIFLADFRFGEAETLRVSFPRVDGLAVGANVWINGVQSGRVEEIQRDPATGRVIVGMKFTGDPKLRQDAEFRVDSLSLLGGKVVSIRNGRPGRPALDTSETLTGTIGGGAMARVEEVAARLEKMLADNEENVAATIANLADASGEARAILAENRSALREGVSSISAFAGALEARGPGLLEDMAAVADRLERGEGTIGMLLADDSLGRDLTAAAGRIAAAADRLETGEGTLGRLLTDDSLARSLEAAAADIRTFTADMRAGEGTLGLLIRDRSLYDEARATLVNLRDATARIDAALGKDSDDNVIGLLLTDPKMAEDLKRSVKALSDFLETQRENAPLTTFAGLLFKPF